MLYRATITLELTPIVQVSAHQSTIQHVVEDIH